MGSDARVLVLNGGSSTVKVALFDATKGTTAWRRATIEVTDDAGPGATLDWVRDQVGWENLDAVGHRIVHGGDAHTAPCRVTEAVLGGVGRERPQIAEHLPREIALIEAVAARRPELPQVACFDTAFHQHLPAVARMLPLPRRLYDRGVRRYGFHGLSYAYLLTEIARRSGDAAARGRLVLAHLGSGASLAAVKDGRSIDTTMGFTPTAGIPMGTRSGDVDPGLVAYLAANEGVTAERFARMATDESGLLGVSGISGDVRELTRRSATEPHAAEALALFCYEVKKRIGGFAAALGGLDRLVFTGGIGENAADVRARICAGLDFLGVVLDDARNAAHDRVISAATAGVVVEVVPTDEARTVVDGVLGVLAATHDNGR